ncbi:TetR/AcrR family transcriptional regulator [Shewanella youngdeokensis]|uniref:TetR/AcrR family transcriptional regulator n=1 Tax=Shewanella youngdeokensis TaxID=2999068 RepID=A0ABZ0JX14_9GAMM|nr:TetR/AcrR family transcriptional regulator [Shewanella sp. DAU334]
MKTDFNVLHRELLTIAEVMILRDGLDNFSLPKLAKESPVALGTLYKHFSNVHDLLISIGCNRFLDVIARQEYIVRCYSDVHDRLIIRCLLRVYLATQDHRIVIHRIVPHQIEWSQVKTERISYFNQLSSKIDSWNRTQLESSTLEKGELEYYDFLLEYLTRGCLTSLEEVGSKDVKNRHIRVLTRSLQHILQPLRTEFSCPVEEVFDRVKLAHRQYCL